MLPASKFELELLPIVKKVLKAIGLFSLKQISQVLDSVALKVVSIAFVKEPVFFLGTPVLVYQELLLGLWVELGDALGVHFYHPFDYFIFQGSVGGCGVEDFYHGFLGDWLDDGIHDVREHLFDREWLLRGAEVGVGLGLVKSCLLRDCLRDLSVCLIVLNLS